MGFSENLTLALFDAIMTLLLMHSIKVKLRSNVLIKLAYIVTASLSVAWITSFVHSNILSHALCALCMVLIQCFYLYVNGSKKATSNILVYFIIILFIIFVKLIVYILMSIFMKHVVYTLVAGMAAQSIALLLVYCMVKGIQFSHIDDFIEDDNIPFRIIISTTAVLYYGITFLWLFDTSNVNSVTVGVVVMILFAIVFNTIILREGYLSNVYKEKLSLLETYFPIIDNMIDELRSKQHDYHNQIQTILAMKKDAFISEQDAHDYASQVPVQGNELEIIKLENRILGAFLYCKLLDAKRKSIDVKVDIRCYSFQSVYETNQLVEIYGILIDNAVEAVQSIDSAPCLNIVINRINGMNNFEVRNSFPYVGVAEINSFFKKGYSTKEQKSRGIGLYKLKKMLDKEKGSIEFYYDTEVETIVARICHY